MTEKDTSFIGALAMREQFRDHYLRHHDPIDHQSGVCIQNECKGSAFRRVVIVFVNECRPAKPAEKLQPFWRRIVADLCMPSAKEFTVGPGNDNLYIQVADFIGLISSVTPCQPGRDETLVGG